VGERQQILRLLVKEILVDANSLTICRSTVRSRLGTTSNAVTHRRMSRTSIYNDDLTDYPSQDRRSHTMPRKYIDCRQLPSDKNCTLAISGTEDEVLDLAIIHAIVSHGHNDPYELRKQLRPLLKDAPEAKSATA
jgi:hypothetical protein